MIKLSNFASVIKYGCHLYNKRNVFFIYDNYTFAKLLNCYFCSLFLVKKKVSFGISWCKLQLVNSYYNTSSIHFIYQKERVFSQKQFPGEYLVKCSKPFFFKYFLLTLKRYFLLFLFINVNQCRIRILLKKSRIRIHYRII